MNLTINMDLDVNVDQNILSVLFENGLGNEAGKAITNSLGQNITSTSLLLKVEKHSQNPLGKRHVKIFKYFK